MESVIEREVVGLSDVTVPSYLDSQDNVPMTRDASEQYMKCMFAEMEDSGALLTEKDAKGWGFAGQVLESRLRHTNPEVKVGKYAALFLMAQCSAVGQVVMWAWTLNRIYSQTRQPVTISELANRFPIGFPSDAEKSRLWDAQKGGAHGLPFDNLVDEEYFWQFRDAAKGAQQ